MRNSYLAIRCALCVIVCATTFFSSSAQDRRHRLTDHVYYLASDSLQGRQAGTEYSRKAAAYIKQQYAEIGVKPFFNDWNMPFSVGSGKYSNVVGVIEGSDPQLKDEYIVLGAHFDHLGVKKGEIYNGADDNASGSSALIEIARELYKERQNLKRSVIIAAFDAEEIGLYGSQALADTLSKTIGRGRIKLMMSIDMVGWYSVSGTLQLEGVATIKNGKEIAESEAAKVGITIDPVNFEKSVMTATDTEGFAKMKVPTLAVSTGLKSPYHKPEDDAELIDYKGLDKVSEYITDLTLVAAEDPSFIGSGKVSKKHLGRSPFLEFGFVAGAGTSHFTFPKSSVTGRSSFAYNAGAQLNINFAKHLSLVTRALYEDTRAPFPAEDDVFGSAYKYRQRAITVPASLQFHGQTFFYYFIGIGGYYTHVLNANNAGIPISTLSPIRDDQFGMAYSIGFRAGPLLWSVDVRSQMNNLFTSGSPRAKLNTTQFTLGYIF